MRVLTGKQAKQLDRLAMENHGVKNWQNLFDLI